MIHEIFIIPILKKQKSNNGNNKQKCYTKYSLYRPSNSKKVIILINIQDRQNIHKAYTEHETPKILVIIIIANNKK